MKAAVLVVDDSLTVRMDVGDALKAAGLREVQRMTCGPILNDYVGRN